MSTLATQLRIGDVAERVGSTTRTIRYYEEIGLLGGSGTRAAGAHRTYTEADVERLQLILRLKDLLGVSLDDLKTLVEAEDARATLRAEWRGIEDTDRRREILAESCALIDRQLRLVRARATELGRLETELVGRRTRNRAILRELED
jgi:DNA-binding transcriptional MerR regulator